ncbi:MAG TPA: heat-inducible transcriptional repressor HrcA [Gaiellales bacterium]|nr:heat-inducible transcriptional repressor HrcA [Gaiellales bacterium]
MSDQRLQLTPRQAVILTRVVTEYIQTGHPVGSKALVESGVVDASSSTVRYELAELESRGLLGHPHTSAGRVPTDAGYRLYAEQLLEQPLGAARLPIDLSEVRNEVDAALRSTTEMMSQVTNLLAVVTAPPLETAEIRHVEVLPLQPRVVMVVVITSTGGVTKRMFPFEDAVDAKLVEWANEYLNERLTGVRLGALTLRQRLYDEGLSPRERGFFEVLEPAFTELVSGEEQSLYVGGAARLFEEMRWADLAEINDLMHALEERVGLLRLLRGALESNRLYVRVGAENEIPHLRSLSLVAANYGLPARNLGTVSLIGPMRMDYATAIRSVRGAAALLSEFVEQVYE